MKDKIKIVLTKERRIRSEMKKPEFVMLQGITSEDITAADVDKALQMGEARVRYVKTVGSDNSTDNKKPAEKKTEKDGNKGKNTEKEKGREGKDSAEGKTE